MIQRSYHRYNTFLYYVDILGKFLKNLEEYLTMKL